MQVGDLAGFMCTEAEVVHKYKYKLLRATFSNLPAGKEQAVQIPTKVRYDAYIYSLLPCLYVTVWAAQMCWISQNILMWESLEPNMHCHHRQQLQKHLHGA